MNDKQKVFLLVSIFSFVIFAASTYHYSTTGGLSSFFGFRSGNSVYHINYLGFISLGSAISTLVGIFLFKDKK